MTRWHQRFRVCLFALVLACTFCGFTTTAYAFNNPELLPAEKTPVVDLARALTDAQEQRLANDLSQFEADTGWKLRVLTQFDRTPGSAVKEYWGLDDKSILLVADARGGNILNFSVGDAVYELLPRTFWIELQTRFGNQFFVRDNGDDQAILSAIDSLKLCLTKDGGCRVVPGLPREQWVLTLVTSIVGGAVFGFAAQPRKAGEVFAWKWALVFAPLWGILFVAFGVGPVVTRTSDWLPLLRNLMGFSVGAIAAYLTPLINRPPSETKL
jgi:hypothetical protein